MHILLIEDDRETASNVIHVLEGKGHRVDVAHDGAAGLVRARAGTYSALIVDRMLPKMDGLTLVKRLRAEGWHFPVLFLTTMTGLNDRVDGLEGGGDDYLVKPFAFSELIARVNAITRRHGSENSQPTRLRVSDLEIEVLSRTASRAGKTIDLQSLEFRLLEYLLRNAGQIVTRKMLLEDVWDLHFDPRTNIVETNLSRLRSKIDRGFATQLIHTVRGEGYVIRIE